MFSGRQRLHRKGVNLLAHSIAQGCIDLLVAAHTRQAFKSGGDDGGEEVPAIAVNLDVLAGQAGGDEVADFGGCGVGHAADCVRSAVS